MCGLNLDSAVADLESAQLAKESLACERFHPPQIPDLG
jgi:hypothetical protein